VVLAETPPPPALPTAGNVIRVPEDFSTIGAGIDAASSGDKVLVSTGTYSENGTIYITKDLLLASTFVDTGNQNNVFDTIIRGDGTNDLFMISGGANVRIEGLTIENARKPITIDAGHGTIRNNLIRNNNSDSISFEGDTSGLVEFNTIINSGDDGIDIDGLRGPYTVRMNTVLGSHDDGMEFRMIDSYLVTGSLKYEVYENTIDGAGGDGIQLIDYPTDSENRREINIHHNYIKNATFAGVGTMPDEMSQRGNLPEAYPDIAFMERVFVTNNTIVNNDNGISGGDKFIVLNNIIADNRLGVANIDGDSRLDYTMLLNNNLFNVPTVVQGSNIIFDDPRLNSDGSLQDGSPAIDAGVSSYIWQGEVVLTVSIFNGSAPDLGWIESDSGSPPP